MKDAKLLIFSLILCLSIVSKHLSAQNLVLPQTNQIIEFNDALFLADSLSEFGNPPDLQSIKLEKFKEQEDGLTSFNPGISTYWLKFSLENDGDLDRQWILDFKNWSYVDLHLEEENVILESFKTGHLLPYKQRQYPVGNNCLILLDVKAKERLNFIVRLESAQDNFIVPRDLSFKVGLRNYVDTSNQKVKRNTFIFLGIFLMMLLYHLFIYLSTRNRSYLYYIGILILMSYMITSNSGYIVEIFSSIENFPQWRGFFESSISSGIPILMIFFTMTLLKTQEFMPKLHKLMSILVWFVLGVTILVIISFNTFGALVMLATLFVVVTFITTGVIAIKRNLPSGRYYLIAYTFSIIGVVTMFLGLNEVIPQTHFSLYYAMPIGYTLEVLFYSLALANIINVLKKENTEKQEKIITQLKENQLLQTKVTRELENKVSERTKEIRAQNKIIEDEKQKSDTLLLNILPESIAEELKSKGSSSAKSFNNVSVMFTDFKGFTKLCENMTPEEIVKNLDYCFRKFDDIASEYKLEKIKTIGDSYMCAEGILEDASPSPENMIEAGFKMLEFIEQWNVEQAAKGEETWQMRIGINSGPITAGVVGKKKFTYDIWGETVNLAARMESSGVPGKINISEYTRALIKDKYKCISRGQMPVKNSKNVEMFFVEPNV